METELSESLPPEQELALAYTPREIREKFRALLSFDQRMARIVAATTEPMLGQMRLAWWREQLAIAPAERPEGDLVLGSLGLHWAGSEDTLTAAINAHEVMVASETLSAADVERYVEGRSEQFGHIFPCRNDGELSAILTAAKIYICADASTRLSDPTEQQLFLEHGEARIDAAARLPWLLRGLGVLQALAVRSLKNGGKPLMEGRGAALTALRAAMIGR